MAYPVDLTYCYLIEPFGTTSGREFPHTGDDFARRKSGTKVLQERPVVMSAFDGVVVDSAWHAQAGNRVIIRYTHGIYGVYGHMAERNVQTGAVVRQGQRIGLVGMTGKVSGPHLHYAQYTNADRARSGIVQYWKNKGGQPLWPSVDAWATASGLVRPSYSSDADKASNPLDPTNPVVIPGEEDDMFTDEDRANLAELAKAIPAVYNWNRDMQPKVDEIWRDVNGLEWLKTRQEQEDKDSFAIAQLFARLPIFDNLPASADAAEISQAVADKLAIPGVTPEVITQIATAVNDEAHRRSAD